MAEGLLVAFVLIVVGALKMWVYETERRKREDGTAGFWTRNLFEGISLEALSGSSDDRSSPRLEDRDVDAVGTTRMMRRGATCPVTGVATEIEIPPTRALWKGVEVRCPSCRRRHIYVPGSGVMT
jgi:hypothetical protein